MNKLSNIKLFLTAICISSILLFTGQTSAQQINSLKNQYRLAKAFEQAGELQSALNIYKKLYSADSKNINYFLALNNIYLKIKDYNGSTELIRSRMRKRPKDVTLYALLGSTYYISNRENAADSIWDAGLKTNPSSPTTYRLIANAAIENRAFDKAIEILNKGKQVAKNSLIFSYDLAQLYSATMRFEKAAKEYCLILAKQPTQAENIKRKVANIYKETSAKTKIIETVKEYYSDSSKPVFIDLLSYLYVLDNRYEDALKLKIKLDEQTGKNGSQIFNFAQNALREKHTGAASQAFKYIIENLPNSAFVSRAKIGFAHALEISLDEKYRKEIPEWKKYYAPFIIEPDEYLNVIKAYQQIANYYSKSEIANKALFRMGMVFYKRLNNLRSADSLFSLVITNSTFSDIAAKANFQKGKIAVLNNDLHTASIYFSNVLQNKRSPSSIKSSANFMLAKLRFWNYDYIGASKKLNTIVDNLKDDNTNDAIQLNLLISTLKNDSTNLNMFAKADLLTEQNKFALAANIYKKLSENKNIFFLKDFAALKYAQLLIALNYYPAAVSLLTKLTSEEKFNLYSDKFLYLLGNTYFYGLGENSKAINTFHNLLEKFPNSLYFDKARQMINLIKNKTSNSI